MKSEQRKCEGNGGGSRVKRKLSIQNNKVNGEVVE